MRRKRKVCKAKENWENVSDQVMIGWEIGASFHDQSQREVKQNQRNLNSSLAIRAEDWEKRR